MISSVLIILFSLALLIYWFRYTCLLVLRTRPSSDRSADVVAANNLRYPEIQAALARATASGPSDELRRSLARDYRLLTYLLEYGAGAGGSGFTLEQRMLMVDFRVMQYCHALAGRLGLKRPRAALREMSDILNSLANALGERTAAVLRV